MKERTILFSAPMVRALLDGRKTQTRRVAKEFDGLDVDKVLARFPKQSGCPYGQPGDRLWVKETFRFTSDFDGDSPARVGERCIDVGYLKPWAPIQYDADGKRRDWKWVGTPPGRDVTPGKTRVSIHMPRWASRILLEISSVRVERLNDCSESDAIAEGVLTTGMEIIMGNARGAFRNLWDGINGAGAWAANPWVWVVEFKRLTPLVGDA